MFFSILKTLPKLIIYSLYSPTEPDRERRESADFSSQHDSFLETSFHVEHQTTTVDNDDLYKEETTFVNSGCQVSPASRNVGVQTDSRHRDKEKGCQTAPGAQTEWGCQTAPGGQSEWGCQTGPVEQPEQGGQTGPLGQSGQNCTTGAVVSSEQTGEGRHTGAMGPSGQTGQSCQTGAAGLSGCAGQTENMRSSNRTEALETARGPTGVTIILFYLISYNKRHPMVREPIQATG
jgi:hypothetical protein